MSPTEGGDNIRNGGRLANDTIEDFALCHLPIRITDPPVRFPDTHWLNRLIVALLKFT